jgi:hypothetical protein
MKDKNSKLHQRDASGLETILNDISTYLPSAQLPLGGNPVMHETAFYFLTGASHLDQADKFLNPFDVQQETISSPQGFVKRPLIINGWQVSCPSDRRKRKTNCGWITRLRHKNRNSH